MKKKPIPKITLTSEKKQIYSELQLFLKRNPEIEYKKLYPFGFSINTATISDDKAEEFLRITNGEKELHWSEVERTTQKV